MIAPRPVQVQPGFIAPAPRSLPIAPYVVAMMAAALLPFAILFV